MTVSVNPFVPKPFNHYNGVWWKPKAELKLKDTKIHVRYKPGKLEVINEAPKWQSGRDSLQRGS
jgi:hypothetical protein